MPLQPQRLSVPMVGGQRPDAASQILPPDGSALVELVNLRQTVTGELRVRDCAGYSGATLGDTDYIGAGLVGERLIGIGSQAIHTTGVTQALGRSRDCTLERIREIDIAPTNAGANGARVDMAYERATDTLCCIKEGIGALGGVDWYDILTDGATVRSGQLPGGATGYFRPRVVYSVGWWLLFCHDAAGNLVYFKRASGAAAWTGPATLVAVGASAITWIDADIDPVSAGYGWLCWTRGLYWEAQPINVDVATGVVSRLGSPAQSVYTATYARIRCKVNRAAGTWGVVGECMVAAVSSGGSGGAITDVFVARYTTGTVSKSNVITIPGNATICDGGHAGLAVCDLGDSTTPRNQDWALWSPGAAATAAGAYEIRWMLMTGAVLSVTSTKVTPCVAPTGAVIPSAAGALMLCEVGGPGQIDSSLVWYSTGTNNSVFPFPIATAATGELTAQSIGGTIQRLGAARAVGGANGVWWACANRYIDSTDASANVLSVWRVMHHSDVEAGSAARMGDVLVVSGGLPLLVGPVGAIPAAITRGPSIVSTVAAAGGSLAAGTYAIACQYERNTPDGLESPSFVTFTTVTVTVNQKITLTITPMLTEFAMGLGVYVSYAGGPYYRFGSGAYIEASGSANITVIVSAPVTTGLILEHGYPGGPVNPEPLRSSRVVAAWGGRTWLGGVEGDPYAVWPSAPLTSGHGPIWSSQLRVVVPSDAGRVTGLLGLDDRLLILCEMGAWYLSGDGVDAQLQGQWGGPIRIPGAAGCLVGRSAVSDSTGAYWWSSRGIERMSRGGEVSRQAPAYQLGVSAADAKCVRAVYDRTSELLRFGMQAVNLGFTAVHESQYELVLDTVRGTWATYEYPQPLSANNCPDHIAVSPAGVVHCLRIGAAPETLGTAGLAYAGSYGYGAMEARISLPVAFDSVSGFQRLWRWGVEFGKLTGDVTLQVTRVSAASPATDTSTQSQTRARVTPLAVETDKWVSQHVAKQEAIRHKLTLKIAQTNNGEALTTVRGMLLEYGIEPGTGRGKAGNKL